MKTTLLYTCTQCGYHSPKWLGRCPECEAWNCFEEEVIAKKSKTLGALQAHARSAQEYESVLTSLSSEIRQPTGISQLDTVLGGGLVAGSLLLLTGEPGIGKSTLTLQIAEALSLASKKVLLISGEESESQIALRAKRLDLQLTHLRLLSESSLETILATAAAEKPDFLIIDSIQVVRSEALPGGAGSVSQVRFATEAILNFAKPLGLAVMLIGHVTKDGTLAGPRVLEHLVDTVLYLEGERSHELRLLRSVKNRFGGVNEVGIFEMAQKGLVQVANPATFLIQHRAKNAIGSALAVTIEGSRPLIVEIQALTNATVFGYPKRTASGFDLNRLNLLLAVLEKHLGVHLNAQDVYINVVSGYRVSDPYCDLAVCLAILSSYYKKPLSPDLVAVGEVGLSGEIRKPGNLVTVEKELTKLKLSPLKSAARLKEVVGGLF